VVEGGVAEADQRPTGLGQSECRATPTVYGKPRGEHASRRRAGLWAGVEKTASASCCGACHDCDHGVDSQEEDGAAALSVLAWWRACLRAARSASWLASPRIHSHLT